MDLTIIFYTANSIPESFAAKVREQLLKAKDDVPLISVSHKPMDFGENIVVDLERSYFNIYRQALVGVKAAKTKYVALCEDDVLYSPDHFKYEPSPGFFAYNMSVWSLYTWLNPAIFSYKDRRNLSGLICERDLFIEAIEERFTKYPKDSMINRDLWSEPAKYERELGVTVRRSQIFYTDIPNIAFSHPTALSFGGLGTRKKIGHMRAIEIPYWNRAEDILKLYV